MKTIEISDFIPGLKNILPETYRLLRSSRIVVHPSVRKITIHGSRGPAGGYHTGSDMDLSFVTDITSTGLADNRAGLKLKEVLLTTLEKSECPVELDLAAIFDRKNCKLACFDVDDYRQLLCPEAGPGCMGIYKIQKGFQGFVPPVFEVQKMYPLLTLWKRDTG